MQTKPIVKMHPSQAPEAENTALRAGWNAGWIDPRLHYRSDLQSRRWLAVFQRWAPFLNRPGCRALYERSAGRVLSEVEKHAVLVALGCGDGTKELSLLEHLKSSGKEPSFVGVDISGSLVRLVVEKAAGIVGAEKVRGVVADLVRADDLAEWIFNDATDLARLITFYGMIPNREPDQILPRLRGLLRPRDRLLFSANLVPDGNLDVELPKILPQYDNAETRDWLSVLLNEAGMRPDDGRLMFSIESGSDLGLRRIVARFVFSKPAVWHLLGRDRSFAAGDSLRVFFSYRYQREQIHRLLGRYGISVRESWITPDSEEGVFLCQRE